MWLCFDDIKSVSLQCKIWGYAHLLIKLMLSIKHVYCLAIKNLASGRTMFGCFFSFCCFSGFITLGWQKCVLIPQRAAISHAGNLIKHEERQNEFISLTLGVRLSQITKTSASTPKQWRWIKMSPFEREKLQWNKLPNNEADLFLNTTAPFRLTHRDASHCCNVSLLKGPTHMW